jgi:hypothetical protein
MAAALDIDWRHRRLRDEVGLQRGGRRSRP